MPSPKRQTKKDLVALQRQMAAAIMSPLDANYGMRQPGTRNQSASAQAVRQMKPNPQLSSFDRLEIYNRQYWFRVLDCLSEDYPGLEALLGETQFQKLAVAYLSRHPSESFTLRNLGRNMEHFLGKNPVWTKPHSPQALDLARLEWAHTLAFDEAALPPISTDDLLDTPPARLKLRLQPYLSLLELNYAADDFLLALRKADHLRAGASNALQSRATSSKKTTRPRLKKEHCFVAVHRLDNSVFYKRLQPEEFQILSALQHGATLAQACTDAFDSRRHTVEQWSSQLQSWFNTWSSFGWFSPRSSK